MEEGGIELLEGEGCHASPKSPPYVVDGFAPQTPPCEGGGQSLSDLVTNSNSMSRKGSYGGHANVLREIEVLLLRLDLHMHTTSILSSRWSICVVCI